MSMTEAMGRIQGIQSMIADLTRPAADTPPAKSVAASSVAASSAAASSLAAGAGDPASFTQALTAALGGTAGTDISALTRALAPGGTTAVGAVGAPPLPASAGSPTGSDVATAAQKYIGVPYVWGGTDPAKGMDCSGFVQRVFKDLGVEVPRVVRDQMVKGTPVASLAEAKPGDLLVSFGGDHISIYLGNGKAIDAPVPGKTIQVRDAWEQHSNLTSIRRMVPAGGAA